MNVLMVTERYFPIWGGAENQLRQLVPHLVKKGCNIKIVTRRWHEYFLSDDRIDDIEVVRLGIPGRGFIPTTIFILSLIFYIIRNIRDINILHSHGAVNLGALCSVFKIFFGLNNVTKIATAGKVTELQNNVLSRPILWFFKKASAIIAMTDEIAEELRAIETPVENIVRITNGVDIDRFTPAGEIEKQKWRKEQGISQEAQVVLFSSRLVYRKGLDLLLTAWSRIVTTVPKAYIMILGSGTDQSDSVEMRMKEYVRNNNIPRVIFLGETEHPELFLGVIDIFVFPSRKEGFPNALMEAMASGLPVIASNIGGVIPLVIDGRTGLLFEPENSLDLAEKLAKLLQDSSLRNKIGRNARLYMSETFTFESIANKYIELYMNL